MKELDGRIATELFETKKAWVLDMDGVVYNGPEPVPGVAETVERLQGEGRQVVFFTNNSTKTRESYVEKLATCGIETGVSSIYTSATITAGRLKPLVGKGGKKTRVFLIGEAGIRQELEGIGAELVVTENIERGAVDHGDVDFVVVGLDTGLTYRKLHHALNCINRGAEFVATNDDATLPIGGGLFGPGTGAIVAALATCSGRQPGLGSPFGKPNIAGFKEIRRDTGIGFGDMVMVGDRPETDILAARRAGITSILVLSGVTKDPGSIPLDQQPDHVSPTFSI